MCIYCDAYEKEHRDEDGQTSVERNHSDRNATTQPSKGVLTQLRSSVADLF